MTNCKHGNGPDCLQCQYERDVASGYPEPWRLWEVSRYGAGFQGYCSSKENPLSGILNNKYRRRHDADEIISEWERGQRTNTFCPECGFGVDVDEDGCCVSCGATAVGSAVDGFLDMIQPDKCDTCRHALPEPMREEPKPWARIYVVDIVHNNIDCQQWSYIEPSTSYLRLCLNAGLCYDTEEKAQIVLNWWNEAVGRAEARKD